jgi:hypothetical protein
VSASSFSRSTIARFFTCGCAGLGRHGTRARRRRGALAETLDGLLRAARSDRALPFNLFLGRIVELPWLSRELALAARGSQGWDMRAGRPRAGDPDRFVAGLLANSAALRDLFPSYTITSVSVEKVLVPTRAMIRARTAGDHVPDERLPYDAMLWVRLESKR